VQQVFHAIDFGGRKFNGKPASWFANLLTCSVRKNPVHMNLVIDHGNTRGKAALFEGTELRAKTFFGTAPELKSWLASAWVQHVIISSVRASTDDLLAAIAPGGTTLQLTAQTPLPISIRYRTPHTLGVDRIAAACGAVQLYPHLPVLAIDAGTCINYEFTDAGGNYFGGAISPGLRMRFESVHHFTARLPRVEPKENPPLIGMSTEECIQSGIGIGLIEEINGVIARYLAKYPDLRVVLCGGDVAFFENYVKHPIFVAPDLVLLGLNGILQHNVKK
jgi:type III pantothenate kinase